MLYSNLRFILVSIFMGLIVVSCDSGGDDHAEHLEAEGFVFENADGEVVYRYFQGDIDGDISLHVGEEIIYSVHFLGADGEDVDDDSDHNHEGSLSFIVDNESIISIVQIDEYDADEHDHDHGDEEHCDEITDETECGNSDHCEWHEGECEDDHGDEEHCDDLDEVACDESEHCEWHADDEACEDDHGMYISITGEGVGATSFKLLLMHGDHADFQTADDAPVQVTVIPEDD